MIFGIDNAEQIWNVSEIAPHILKMLPHCFEKLESRFQQ